MSQVQRDHKGAVLLAQMPGERPSLRTTGRRQRSEPRLGTQHRWTALRGTGPGTAEGCVLHFSPGTAVTPPASAVPGGRRGLHSPSLKRAEANAQSSHKRGSSSDTTKIPTGSGRQRQEKVTPKKRFSLSNNLRQYKPALKHLKKIHTHTHF